MTTNTKGHRRRRTADTNHNSNPTFLQVALRPYRRDDSERYIVINTRTIQRVSPPYQIWEINPATGETIGVNVPDPRYTVTFKVGRERENGLATRADLVAAGIPRPPGEPITARRPQAAQGASGGRRSRRAAIESEPRGP